MTNLIERADELERLTAEHDDYVIRANANVCALNKEIGGLRAQLKRTNDALDKEFNNGIALCAKIEQLRAHIDTLVQERDIERKTYNDVTARHLLEIERLHEDRTRRHGAHLFAAASIVERLRARIGHFDEASLLHEFLHYLKSDAALDKEAVDEIERLHVNNADLTARAQEFYESWVKTREALELGTAEIERLKAVITTYIAVAEAQGKKTAEQ